MSRSLLPRDREFVFEMNDSLRAIVGKLEGRGGVSVLDRSELNPCYGQLLHHLDRALVWADEMRWIVETELSPKAAA